MYLLILESIGTSELMLIGLVAMIVFGPRKIPEIARTIGKVMTELRRSTDDFKKTWEREAGFEAGSGSIENRLNKYLKNEDGLEKTSSINQEVFSPEIKQLNKEDFDKSLQKKEPQKPVEPIVNTTSKSEWL